MKESTNVEKLIFRDVLGLGGKFMIGSIVCVVTICVVVVMTLTIGKIHHTVTVNRAPQYQLNTTWQSEDGSIVFYVKNYKAVGTMIVNGQELNIYIQFNVKGGDGAEIYPARVLNEEIIKKESMWEKCSCSYKSKNKFVITIEEGTYLEEGKRITFYRVDGSTITSE